LLAGSGTAAASPIAHTWGRPATARWISVITRSFASTSMNRRQCSFAPRAARDQVGGEVLQLGEASSPA
jgi:hypothetical protein